MTTREALCALFVAILMATAGLTWMFGPVGLFGGAALTSALTLTANKKEDDGG